MDRRGVLALITAALACPLGAQASPLSLVPRAQKVGQGRMSVFGLHIFDARLHAPDGRFSMAAPFALKLTYLNSFKGREIAKRSVDEMRKQGASRAQLEVWGAEMVRLFPDVKKGDSLTGVRDAAGVAHFYRGETAIGKITSPGFAEAFFSIWLGEKSSNPTLRNRLLGKV